MSEWRDLGMHGVVSVIPMSVEPVGIWASERDLLDFIGKCAGNAYKAQDFSAPEVNDVNVARALNCIRDGHHSVLEHVNMTVLAIVDRGVSHALVRHRHTAFTQSSTIYERSNSHITVIAVPAEDPYFPGSDNPACTPMADSELESYKYAAVEYMSMLREGVPPSRARDALPTVLATRIVMSTHIGEWVYITKRRAGKGDTVRMHCFAHMLDQLLREHYPRIMKSFDTYYDRRPL